MKLLALLPPTRFEAGTFWVLDERWYVTLGPVPARGEADNAQAAAHHNTVEDPTQAYGDHPAGQYRVTAVVPTNPNLLDSYGPAFLVLDPLAGEAREAKKNGRTGLGIHGGILHPDGRLRETYGCLRVQNEMIERLLPLIERELRAAQSVLYECVVGPGLPRG